jgi:DNA-directed RNA polymerase subunit RPC12/RpoP
MTKALKIKSAPAERYGVKCPACGGDQLKVAHPCGLMDAYAWRCLRCSVRFIVTNPSYLRIK